MTTVNHLIVSMETDITTEGADELCQAIRLMRYVLDVEPGEPVNWNVAVAKVQEQAELALLLSRVARTIRNGGAPLTQLRKLLDDGR